MVIDFGNAEAIRARHEVDLQRGLEARTLSTQARQSRQNGKDSRDRQSRYWNRVLCELDFQRVVLADRLARFGLDPSVLRGDETALFSAGRCG